MAATTFTLKQGSQDFFAKHWAVDKAKAVYCMVHGHGEHVMRYDHVAEFMNQAGIAAMGHDLHGHGQTKFKKGHIPSYEAVLDSIDALLEEVRSAYGDLPLFLLGHSMGGNFVAKYVLSRNPNIAGAVITSPWFRLAFAPKKIDLFLAKVMMRIYPSFTQGSKLDANGLSHDAAVVKAYQDDPLVHDLVSPVLFSTVTAAGEYALEHASELKTPTLLLHGAEDPVTSHDASAEFAKKAGDIVHWKSWEGMFHELHNEINKEEVLNYILNWMMKTIS